MLQLRETTNCILLLKVCRVFSGTTKLDNRNKAFRLNIVPGVNTRTID